MQAEKQRAVAMAQVEQPAPHNHLHRLHPTSTHLLPLASCLSLLTRSRAHPLTRSPARYLPTSQVEQERARREQAQANEERQRAGMQKRMMWLLHQQVQRYWLLAKMCNDVIVHATTSGLFLYLSPKCKALLGYD